MRAFGRRLTAVMVMAACGLVASTAPAWAAGPHAKTGGSATYGADISTPQCGSAYPSGVAFGIAGVTGGRVFSQNSCLAGSSGELAWAASTGAHAALYMNTADPSTVSAEWADPSGNPEGFANYTPTAPAGGWQPCNTTTDANYGCDYDYGWNSAQYAYQQAAAAASASGVSPATLATMPWWLDVETANSWTVNDTNPAVIWNAQAADAADLQGAIDGLQAAEHAYDSAVPAPVVGIYSSASSWQSIMGTGTFPSSPTWVPGARTQRAATSACGGTGASGGAIQLSQWTSSYDYDVPCSSAY